MKELLKAIILNAAHEMEGSFTIADLRKVFNIPFTPYWNAVIRDIVSESKCYSVTCKEGNNFYTRISV